MEYEQALQWLHSLPRVVESPSLDKMKKLMQNLGNPQDRLRFVHVAGTNGKGSTVTMLASILSKAGYKTGSNLSPFVLDFRERFQINGEMVSKKEVTQLLTDVKEAAESLPAPPKEFEAVTAAALLCFARHNCDIVCIEAGMGGQNDPTNIIQNTLVACLLRIGYDHTEILGETLEEITQDKCGIIKPGCAVVSYPAQPQRAVAVIHRQAEEKKCPLVIPAINGIHKVQNKRPFQNKFCYKGYDVTLHLTGEHQIFNAIVVIEAALALRTKDFLIADEAILQGLAGAKFAARIEVLSTEPLVILDGAHNEDSAKALAKVLAAEGIRDISAVVGVMRDKQVEVFLRQVAPFVKKLYAVTPSSPRSLPAEELAALAKPMVGEAIACATVEQAVKQALQDKKGLLVCGSLYLASETRPLLISL